ncbi:hypothetical protein [Actinoplanes sp. NPDC051859]
MSRNDGGNVAVLPEIADVMRAADLGLYLPPSIARGYPPPAE